MREPFRDQAHGLRELFRPFDFPAFAIWGQAAQRGAVAQSLAGALATLGRTVLVVDLDGSLPPARRGRVATLADVHAAGLPLADAATRLDPRVWCIDDGGALAMLMARRSEGLSSLAHTVATLAAGGRSCATVVCADGARIPALARWLGVQCCPILVLDPRQDTLTAAYGEMKALAQTGAAGEIDAVAIARGGASTANAAFDRLAATAARFLPLEVRRLATVDERELDAIGSADLGIGAAQPQARVGRALAGALARRWPELAPTPSAGIAPALRDRLTA